MHKTNPNLHPRRVRRERKPYQAWRAYGQSKLANLLLTMDLISRIGNQLLAQDENGGALPTLYAAVADVPGNSFASVRLPLTDGAPATAP